MRRLLLCMIISTPTPSLSGTMSSTDVVSHAAEIEAFATIMATTRTAAERCPGVTIEEAVIVAAKGRLRIVDDDYFVFRAEAHRLFETLERDAGTIVTDPTWCAAVLSR